MPIPEKAKPIDPALTARLGQIVVRWNTMENWLMHLLASLIGADPAAMMVVTATAGISSNIQWLRLIIEKSVNDQPELQQVLDLLTRADELRLERNELVHGLWEDTGCEPGTCLVNTIRFNRAELIIDRLVTTADLDEFLGHIDDWITDFMTVGVELGYPRKRGETKSIFAD